MRTFKEYVAVKENSLFESFAFVGRMIEVEDYDFMEAEQAAEAIKFVQMLATDLKSVPSHINEFLQSLHPKGLSDLRKKLSFKLHTILPEFENHYEKIRQMANGDEPKNEVFGVAWNAFKWLFSKILSPVLSLVLRSIRKAVEVFLLPYDYSKTLEGPFGAAGGFATGIGYLCLSVLAMPYFMALGAPVAAGGFVGLWTLYWWSMEWFKRNILQPAIEFSEKP